MKIKFHLGTVAADDWMCAAHTDYSEYVERYTGLGMTGMNRERSNDKIVQIQRNFVAHARKWPEQTE